MAPSDCVPEPCAGPGYAPRKWPSQRAAYPISVQSVQFSWFRGTSRASDFLEFLKGPRGDNETWPFGPILKTLTPNDAADREDLQPTPQIHDLSPSVGTSEICDFQFYANSLVFWPRPVASVRGVDLDDREVVAEKVVAGNFSQPTCCCLLTTSGHCPGSPRGLRRFARLCRRAQRR